VPGRKTVGRVTLSVAQLQNLAETVAALKTILAGCDLQFEVSLSIKTGTGVDLGAANEVLAKIKEGWKV
jgi:hypothetical protein